MGHTESGATWIGFASSVCHDKGCVSDCHVPDVDHTGHRKTEGLSGRERGNEEGGGRESGVGRRGGESIVFSDTP